MAGAFLRVVSPEDLQAQEREAAEQRKELLRRDEPTNTQLINYIRQRWGVMRDHRASCGLDERLITAMRAFKGQYDPSHLSEIRKFGGSEVYARLTATKTRGATALLRDIYFGAEKPWGIKPTPDPQVPGNVAADVMLVVQAEAQTLQQAGVPVDDAMVRERMAQLLEEARRQSVQQARDQSKENQSLIDDFLVEGGFYKALEQVLIDIPLFPFAVMKGPFVEMVDDVVWNADGPGANIETKPRLTWKRISPFDFYFSPGVSDIAYAEVAERLKWTRRDLNGLMDLPGWNREAVRAALSDYDKGHRDWVDQTDSQRAVAENREDPNFNRSDLIDALEYHGPVKGEMLLEFGFGQDEVPDPLTDYQIEAWIVGQYVLKVQINPNPRKRHPYWMTSYEKVPGTPIGNALPDILGDIQDVANASLRNLVNNMSIASGPQVVVLDNRFSQNTDTDELYPWKRWHMADEPGQGALPAVSFFQPNSNAQELLGIYRSMAELADEISAIPRHAMGMGAGSGAGRTASGLSMLMDNASKMLQQVAANIDNDMIAGTVRALYDMLMLTTDRLTGDEEIEVLGVNQVIARQAERQRQLEFLQITANPLDTQVVGVEGRAVLLREIARGLGLDGENIVPSRAELARRMQEAQAAQAAAAAAQGDQSEAPADNTGPVQNAVQTRDMPPGGG